MKAVKWMMSVALFGCCCFATESGFEGRGSINSVQERSGENRQGNDVEILKINTSQTGGEFSGVMVVSVELKDKNNKTYYGKLKVKAPPYRISAQGNAPTGGIAWEIEVDSSSMRRPKFTGYSLEFRYEGDGDSVLLDAEYEDCDSAEELAERNKDSIAVKLKKGKVKVDFPRN